MPSATISKVGNSRAIFIPVSICDEAFLVGNKVSIEYVGEGTLVIRAERSGKESRRQAFEQLMTLVADQSELPWEDDSRAADRALVGTRHD